MDGNDPKTIKQVEEILMEWMTIIPMLAGPAIVGIFYAAAYFLTRPKRSHAEIVQTTPPENLSPAELRYILNGGFDLGCLLAAMFSARAKGVYQLASNKSGFALRLDPAADSRKLSNDEKAAMSYHKSKLWKQVVVKKATVQLRKMNNRLNRFLTIKLGKYVKTNRWINWVGIGLSVLLFPVLAFVAGYHPFEMALFYSVMISLFSMGPLWFLISAIRDKNINGALTSLATAIAASAIFIHVLGDFIIPSAVFFLISFLLNFLLFDRFHTHTPAGMKLLEEAEAFRNYLSSTKEKGQESGRRLPKEMEDVYMMAAGLKEKITDDLIDKLLEGQDIRATPDNYLSMYRV